MAKPATPITDLHPSNTGSLCWRDDGRAKGKLVRAEVFEDKQSALLHADMMRPACNVKVHRRDLRVDGARITVYALIARAKDEASSTA